MTLGEVEEQLELILERWRGETTAELTRELVELDDLLRVLDDPTTDPGDGTVDELRGRIEMLMDEIDLALGDPRSDSAGADIDMVDSGIDVADEIAKRFRRRTGR